LCEINVKGGAIAKAGFGDRSCWDYGLTIKISGGKQPWHHPQDLSFVRFIEFL
jgi:hypothetical protein